MNANQILADQRQFVEDCEARLQSYEGVLLGQGFVVVPAGLMGALAFDVDANRVASNPRVVCVLNAPMFSREDAENLAANCFNGNSEPAHALHIRDALQRAVASGRDLIAALERVAA